MHFERRFRTAGLGAACLVGAITALLLPWTVSAQIEAPPSNSQQRFRQAAKDTQESAILVGAGDIASCKAPAGARATAQLIEKTPGTVFAAGDLAYESGSARDFAMCYDPTWGRFKERTRPALGNHEYGASKTAAPYFEYWGVAAGPEGKGYYSYNLGAWHIIVLNTNCNARGLGGCAAGSEQELWLRNDLRDHPATCTLAYGHHTLFSSGVFAKHAIHPELRPLWQALYEAHADLVLAGHEHSYERFAPQDPDGRADGERGIREIVVGTGGRSHTPLGAGVTNSEIRNDNTFGVLKLTLEPGRYRWEFVPVTGGNFHDSDSGVCHGR